MGLTFFKTNKMKDSEELIEEKYVIPADLLIEIFAIILKEGLKHEVFHVNENRSLMSIAVSFDKKLAKHQKIRLNIRELLEEYNEYRWRENETPFWKE